MYFSAKTFTVAASDVTSKTMRLAVAKKRYIESGATGIKCKNSDAHGSVFGVYSYRARVFGFLLIQADVHLHRARGVKVRKTIRPLNKQNTVADYSRKVQFIEFRVIRDAIQIRVIYRRVGRVLVEDVERGARDTTIPAGRRQKPTGKTRLPCAEFSLQRDSRGSPKQLKETGSDLVSFRLCRSDERPCQGRDPSLSRSAIRSFSCFSRGSRG